MRTDTDPFGHDPDAALREIAKNPAAFAHYLADFQRVLLNMQGNLEVLLREARLHCRKTRVDGDKWGQARLRSYPVEKSLNNVIGNLKSSVSGLEKSAHQRAAHDEKLVKIENQRKEKAQLKAQKKTPPLQAAPENAPQGGASGGGMGYGGPASIYDLGRRESA